jgi:hypothetical protein
MAEGLGFKTFTTGEVLTAADVNGYLMQGVLVFASEAARDAAITSPQEGQFAFTKDNNSLWYYSGAAWVASGATGDIEGVTAGTGISGGGTSGTVTITNSMATEIDAKGDLVVGTGADIFARLAVGANGTVLTAASGEATGLEWAAPAAGGFVGCSLYASANISLANDASPILTWNSEIFDTDTFHSTVTNTSRITIPSGKGGKYLLIASIPFAANSGGYRLGGFLKNGANNLYANQVANLSATIGPFLNFSTIVEAVATDYFEVQVNQTSGGNLNFLGGIGNNRYSAIYLGA